MRVWCFLALGVAALLSGGSPVWGNSEVSLNISLFLADDGQFTEEWAGDGFSEGRRQVEVGFGTGGSERMVPLQFEQTSGPFLYSGSPELTFFVEDRAGTPATVARVLLPEDVSDILLVFVTRSMAQLAFDVFPVDLSGTSTRPNHLRLVSLFGTPVAWSFAGRQGILQPYESESIRYSRDAFDNRLQFAQFDQSSQQWRVVYSRLLRLWQGQRYDAILLPGRGGNSQPVNVRIVADYIEIRRQRAAEERAEVEEASPDNTLPGF